MSISGDVEKEAYAGRPPPGGSALSSDSDDGATTEKMENPADPGADADIGAAADRDTATDLDVEAEAAEAPEGHPITKTETQRSIAEGFSPLHEFFFICIICSAQLCTQAGTSQALVILHIIGDSFGITNPGVLSWLIAGYALTVGTFILPAGRLGDVFGYKRMLLIGIAWYSLWSVIAGVAVYSNSVLFIFSRVLQGIGPALCLPNALAILGATYGPGRRKAMVFSAFGATAPMGAIVGATFASLFSLAWWPWTFWAFGIALAGLGVGSWLIIPDPPHKVSASAPLAEKIRDLDLPGGLAGVLALVLFNFAWNQAPIDGWGTPQVIVTLVLGVICFGVFALIEVRYAPSPLVPMNIFTADVSFVLAAVACGWGCFGIWIFFLWQQEEVLRGHSPLLATAYFSPVVISGAVAAACTGMVLHKIGPAPVMMMAMTAFTVGSILSATAPLHQIYWGEIFVTMLVMPFGMDMSFPAATIVLSDAVGREHQGTAASLIITVVNYSISIGLGIAGTVGVHVDHGSTPADLERSYRASQYVGVALAGLGMLTSAAFLYMAVFTQRGRQVAAREMAEED